MARTTDERASREEARAGSGWTTAFDLILLVGGLIILHIVISGAVPSGGDGGNWLALAREWLGEQVMAGDVVYEPTFIGLLGSLLRVFGPIDALLVAAFVAEAILVAGVYFFVRDGGRVPALASALLMAVCGYRLEAYAWGAYPQILAIGLGLITVWAAMRAIKTGAWAWFAVMGVGVVSVLSTHKLVGGLLLLAIPAAGAHALWLSRFPRRILVRAGAVVLAVWLIGAPFITTWLRAGADGVEPTLNPLGLSRVEQLLLPFDEAAIPWLCAVALALIGFFWRSWDDEVAPTISACFGWVVASAAAFAALGEPRVLIQAQIALLPVAVLVLWLWWQRRNSASGWRRGGILTLGFAGLVLAGSLVLTGLHRYDVAADWYRVVGQQELAALTDLKEHAEPGDVAVASRGPNGNPIGWWVQGFAGIPTYTGIDSAFLAFPDERVQAEMADRLFTAPPEEAASTMDELEARFLILDRRGSDVGWLSTGETTGLAPLTDGTLRIMEIS
jgi:hypothetical protein